MNLLNRIWNSKISIIYIFLVTFIVLILDITTPRGIAIWLFYFFILYYAAFKYERGYVFLLVVIITVQMILGWLASPLIILPISVLSSEATIINRSIAIIVIWILSFSHLLHIKMEEAYKESQIRLSGIVDSAMDAIITIDSKQHIILFNNAAEKMFKISSKEVMGTSINRFVPEALRFAHSTHIERFGETGITNRSMGELGSLKALRNNGEEFPIEASISQLNIKGNKLYTVILRDISERIRSENVLRESEQRFKTMADTAPVLIWIADTSKKCIYFNKTWLSFTGRSLEQEIGFGWTESIHPDDFDRCISTYNENFEKRTEFTMDYRLKRFDGVYRWILDNGIPRFTPEGTFEGFIGSCHDINDSKEFESILKGNLKEKEILLKEVHHRVKNNLQIIVSLLNLQKATVKNPRLIEVLIESQNRVQSMALIHEKLYQSKNIGVIDFTEYITELASRLISSYRMHDSLIRFVPEIEQVNLNIDVAISLGLIINEIITNSLKYAFPPNFDYENKEKIIAIDLKKNEDGYILTIRDNGIGLPEGLDISKMESLGLQLVTTLVEQISGNLRINRKNGTEFIIHFREKDY